ncbi:hypothetical protein IU487_35550 [Nocardia puris]|uniref:hypothetical protein n=1 Tax=Nocardia puris TaxID=208602 RepID=UPI001892E9B3|nr:hypothetical protein [Nocardia puris]MBF6216308.1 hypothetical protein [Nocardia puris]
MSIMSDLATKPSLLMITAIGISGALLLVWLAGCDDPAPTTFPDSGADHPTGVRWIDYQGVAVPHADQGPGRVEGPAAAGFEHSPPGAALAAIHATVRMSLAPDHDWVRVGQAMLAPGPGRDTWAAARAQLHLEVPIPAATAPQILGYQVARYHRDRAEIAVYVRHGDASLTRQLAVVVWLGEDWRLLLPPEPDAVVSAVATTPADTVRLGR